MHLIKTVEDSQPFGQRRPLEFDGIVFMLNPNSTRYKRMLRFCELIKSDYPSKHFNVREFETQSSPFGSKLNAEKLAEVLQPEDVVCVLGGDGGFNIGVNAVKLSGLKVPLLAAKGGNASVMHKVTTGQKSPGGFMQVLQEGRLADVRPMTVKIEDGVEPQIEIDAGFCIAVGGSARVVDMLGRDWFRKNILSKNSLTRIPLEVAVGLGAIALSPEFEINQARNTSRPAYEILFSNVQEMSKGLLRFPIMVTNDELYKIESPQKSPMVAYNLGQAALARIPGEHIDTSARANPWEYDFTVVPPDKGKLYGQIDGDGFRIASPTQFNVTHSPAPFRVVTFEHGQIAA